MTKAVTERILQPLAVVELDYTMFTEVYVQK